LVWLISRELSTDEVDEVSVERVWSWDCSDGAIQLYPPPLPSTKHYRKRIIHTGMSFGKVNGFGPNFIIIHCFPQKLK